MQKADNFGNWIWTHTEDMIWYDEEDVDAIADPTPKIERRRLVVNFSGTF